MIRRIRNYEKKAPSKDAHKLYIICEGKGTEPNYFSFFEGCSSNLQVITIPPSVGTDPLKLMERAKEVFLSDISQYSIDYAHGDTVWFVIDTDTWEKEGKIMPLRDFCAEKNSNISKEYDEVKSYSAWNVAQSNPCFEIWLYYHFEESAPKKDDIENYSSFKHFVDSSISGGFDFLVHPAYIEDAIHNSQNNYKESEEGKPLIYSTEMYKLGLEIMKFTKRNIDILKNKLG